MGETILGNPQGMCAHISACFLSFARLVSFCCPKALLLVVEVALSGALLWILWRAIMEREGHSWSQLSSFFLQLSLIAYHHLVFFLIIGELMNCCFQCQQMKLGSLSHALVWGQEASLIMELEYICTQEHFTCLLMNTGDRHETPIAVSKTCHWAPHTPWWPCCLWLWMNSRGELSLLALPSLHSAVLHLCSSKHQRVHFNYKIFFP